MIKLDEFERAFFECALWSTTDNATDSGGDPLDENYSIADIAEDTIADLLKDCTEFREANAGMLDRAGADAQNGHDFWLTRNRHGAGFWDRGYPTDVSDALTAASHAYGNVDLYVGDDGKIYC